MEPRTEGDEIGALVLARAERVAQKKRINAEINEEIKAYDEAIMDKAEHSNQIPLPLDGEA